jgi:endonuclease/exonuclease/phosphatase (EEP) superfamily protein YafD
LAPLFLPAANGNVEGGENLKLLVFNINLRNDYVEDVVEHIKHMDPDVFCLLETGLSWESIYDKNFKKEYGYKKSELRTDCFGVLFCSRLPVKDAKIIYFSESKVPSVSAKVLLKGREIQITAVHPLPPSRQETFQDRNEFLQNAGELMKANGGLQVFTGDLNTTPWNWSFGKLLKTSGLKDSGRGLGFQPTWLVGSAFLRMPIDHCLVSPEITVIKREIGPVLGSDHYPQYIELRIP